MNADDDQLLGIDLRTPKQIIEAFYVDHTLNEVKLTLLETLQGYVLNEQPGVIPSHLSERQVITVFDSLIGLVESVKTLMDDGTLTDLG